MIINNNWFEIAHTRFPLLRSQQDYPLDEQNNTNALGQTICANISDRQSMRRLITSGEDRHICIFPYLLFGRICVVCMWFLSMYAVRTRIRAGKSSSLTLQYRYTTVGQNDGTNNNHTKQIPHMSMVARKEEVMTKQRRRTLINRQDTLLIY